MTGWYVLGAVWVSCMIAGAWLGARRGNAAFGFLFPFVLGPIGLLLTYALLKDEPSRPADADAGR